MQPYSDYDFYKETFKGALEQAEYERQAHRARGEIDRLTQGRGAGAGGIMLEKLRFCECEVIDAMHEYAKVPKGIASENTDGYSVAYTSNSRTAETVAESKEYLDICRRYLRHPINLLSRTGAW